MNDTRTPDTPDTPDSPDSPESPDGPETSDGPADSAPLTPPEQLESPDLAEAESPDLAEAESEVTSVYVRRGRTPTLGFWVALAIAVPTVVALLIAPFFDFADLSGVLNFMLVVAVFVGLPLAAIAALVDAIRHRDGSRRRR